MGFFDIGVDTTAKASTATATAPADTSVSFDSGDLLIIDDTPTSASSVTSTELPNTASEIFEAPTFDVTPEVSLFDSVVTDVASDANIAMESSMTAEANAHETEAHAAAELSFDMPSFDAPTTVETVSMEEAPAMETAPVDFMPSFDMAPAVETVATVETAPVVEAVDTIDPEDTLRKAIAELETIAAKIQTKADAAFAEEARLLAEKAAAEEAHKLAMTTIKKAAEAARNSALEIQKSGERTAAIKKALEAQAA